MSFVTESGRDVIEEWDVEETFEAGESFRAMLKTNHKTKDYRQWTCWNHPMKGEAKKYGIVELDFPADKREYRVLCKFNGKMCIVLLCVCYHKGSNWTPKGAVDIAIDRAKALEAGRVKPNVIKIENSI